MNSPQRFAKFLDPIDAADRIKNVVVAKIAESRLA